MSNTAGTKDLKDVLEMVCDIAAEWDDLGLALGLKSSSLDSIEADERSCRKRLHKVVAEWLKGNGGECTWNFLCEAIKGPLVKNISLAQKIEQAHCTNS